MSAGWTLAKTTITGDNFQVHPPKFELLETVKVPANDADGVISTIVLENDKNYFLRVYGTADACSWGCGYSIIFDAEYSTSDGTNWVDGVAPPYDFYGPNLLDLMVNNNFVDWDNDTTYNNDHTYWHELRGDGNPLYLKVNDIYYPNNTGSLEVDIYGETH